MNAGNCNEQEGLNWPSGTQSSLHQQCCPWQQNRTRDKPTNWSQITLYSHLETLCGPASTNLRWFPSCPPEPSSPSSTRWFSGVREACLFSTISPRSNMAWRRKFTTFMAVKKAATTAQYTPATTKLCGRACKQIEKSKNLNDNGIQIASIYYKSYHKSKNTLHFTQNEQMIMSWQNNKWW